jgi:thiol-disulfide isomerase/thioredoxin
MIHPVFAHLRMQQLHLQDFDSELKKSSALTGIFFWGHDCPNCEVAKRMMEQDAAEILALDLRWFHVNTYEDFDLGTRFGLHGIPTFIFFHQGKRLGKISPFPGMDPFLRALRDLKQKYSP